MPNDLLGPPYGVMPPAPEGLKRHNATRQNTLRVMDGEPVLVRPPQPEGGPGVWTWQLMNNGPSALFVRWDGLGYAGVDDPHSLRLARGEGFRDVNAQVMTFASGGNARIAFTADNVPPGDPLRRQFICCGGGGGGGDDEDGEDRDLRWDTPYDWDDGHNWDT